MTLARDSVRTIALFVLVLVGLELVYVFTNQSAPMVTLTQATAQVVTWMLALVGELVRIDGTVIYSPKFNMRIVSECTAITPIIVLAAATIAVPAPLVSKLKGIILGASVLHLVNLVRIISLYYVGVMWPDMVEFVHLVLWQAVLVVLAVGLWGFWAQRVREHHAH
jgi:exosortase/archaeosortase family protein